ncbi:hypothetical protein [Geobacter sp. SVR]|uniref:hypothetical protein n=1 Tax=Geobacter sp. SVR TaxID=2495594 RepID=UPI00143F032F|nr:hypothetical protein [Geobacter sp. SVR]BCS55194.1 hypothetical protein GSVR_35020 [Geobacter sp. SVR]GCF85995.1 hypothetical protein GSbR_25950 [Geobacter sp. SVR]
MMIACQIFLTERLEELTLRDGSTRPYRSATPENIFFTEMPLDFLKDNDFAVCCLPLQDRDRKHGRLIARTRNAGKTAYDLTRRRYQREIMFRCLLYGSADALWGDTSFVGMAEQFRQAVANYRVIADTDNSAIRVNPQDGERPSDSETERDRKLRRPRLAIVRIVFTGGLQTTTNIPIIPSVTITPHVGA